MYMIKENAINADACYSHAERRAMNYFNTLYDQVKQKTYASTLTLDINLWKKSHIHHYPFISLFSRRKDSSKGYHDYIKWLNYAGKLDDYLDRSISYILMRDMGKDLSTPETQTKVRDVVKNLKTQLIDSSEKGEADAGMFGMDWLYKSAQKDGIETTMICLIDKLKIVSSHIPEEIDADRAKVKLIKIIAGVVMNELDEIGDDIPPEERTQRLDKAIRLGYAYGLTYPFIDDLLDSKVLSAEEEKRYSDMIRTTLITGSVPGLGNWDGKNKELIHFVHSELKSAFEYIKDHQPEATKNNFLEQAYVFFRSQEVDRLKDLTNQSYTNEELYIPVILKSASSRLIVHYITNGPKEEEFINRTFYYGIYNQLSDDLTDMFSDLEEGSVTPYTYYYNYHTQRPDLINPFELYWAVVCNLIHNVYHADPKSREVILNRAINSQKRLKENFGAEKYKEIMELFAADIPEFNKLIQKMVRKADDVNFFDKLIRDHMITTMKNESKQRKRFSETIKTVRHQINDILNIPKSDGIASVGEPIIDAANYSLNGGGKRLRPIVTWMMGVNEYGLKRSAIEPLIKSLEYMHTASLIFDDLPAQDNASMRRGRPTIHQVYNTSVAELTALFLTQKAIEEQTSLDEFDPKTVLRLIQYTAKSTEDMCRGQMMDLNAKGKQLTLDQLNMICFYKTGIGFEASLVMPAILSQANESEIAALKKFSYHFGIAFQIKDDLLDVEGDVNLLGKSIGIDAENNNSTFVSILGSEGAKKAMWDHYCLAMEALQKVPRNTAFLKYLLDYSISRDH
nr:polyprenyl synthetase family protein [Lentibacillus sp. Marseille-P4043]